MAANRERLRRGALASPAVSGEAETAYGLLVLPRIQPEEESAPGRAVAVAPHGGRRNRRRPHVARAYGYAGDEGRGGVDSPECRELVAVERGREEACRAPILERVADGHGDHWRQGAALEANGGVGEASGKEERSLVCSGGALVAYI